MKQRLLDALPIASIAFAALIFFGPDVLLAQQSRSSDSQKSTSEERRDRGRSSSRNVESARDRDASRSTPAARPQNDERRARSTTPSARGSDTARTPSRTRSTSSGRIDSGGISRTDGRGSTRTDGRAGGSAGDRRPTDRGTEPSRDRYRDQRNDRDGDPRGDRDSDRRGDRDHDRRGDRDNDRRGDRDNDRQGDRDHDRRGDRDYDRRGDREYDRRDYDWRDYDRRGGRYDRGHGNGWGRPRVVIDINWPWVHRHERRWSPRYRYRQVVYVDAGWGAHRRESRLDLRTFYRHRVREASPSRAVVDIEIDRIEIYENGFFVGEVQSIPAELARMRAVVDRRHGVQFDRDVFLLGDPYVGFEMISTRHYDGFVLNKYRASHGIRAGALDLRRERVVPLRRSRFFDPRDFSGFVPLNLLPEDAEWLIDYGYDSYSGHYWRDDDRYYYGFSDLDDYHRFGGDRANYTQTEPRGSTEGREAQLSRVTPELQALEQSLDETFETDAGAKIRLKRDSSIERID